MTWAVVPFIYIFIKQRHREFTRRCFMELRAGEAVSIESSTGFEHILLKCTPVTHILAVATTAVARRAVAQQTAPGSGVATGRRAR